MSDTMFLQRCQSFIDCHLNAPRAGARQGMPEQPSVTISRQAGAGGITVATKLAAWLQQHIPPDNCVWTVFHKNLVQKVLEDHKLPARMAQFMPEDRVSAIQDAMEEILGLHPPTESLLHQTTETILHLAELGNVILVGRAANIITAHLPQVFHVRLVGSAEHRARHVMEVRSLSQKAALAYIKKEDAARARYVRRNYGRDIDDPQLYHAVLNTDRMDLNEVVSTVGSLVAERCRR